MACAFPADVATAAAPRAAHARTLEVVAATQEARRPAAADQFGHLPQKLPSQRGLAQVRPGPDEDQRFQQLADDPRDQPDAPLGKAQRAALGERVPAGSNTASYSPSSTLVRPTLRFICSSQSNTYSGMAGPDDFVAVPEFFCAASDMDLYERLHEELIQMTQTSSGEFPVYQGVLMRIQEYFATEQLRTCLTWHSAAGDPGMMSKSDDFDELQRSGEFEYTVHCVFGRGCELQLQRRGHEDFVAVPCVNGCLFLLGAAVLSRYRCLRAVSDTAPVLSITVLTSSALRRCSSAVKPGEVPCQLSPGLPRRPAMRICAVGPQMSAGLCPISHDDVILIPEFFCETPDLDPYYALLQEIREGQSSGVQNAKWESWHEGAHLLTKNPSCSRTFSQVVDTVCQQFDIASRREALGMRFNWYRDSSDWKPFHHDSAAFNPQMAEKQNCTVGVSLGASRELGFKHTKSGDLICFPQTNGMLLFFGRDVNIRWQHGLNAVPPHQQSSKGRISIILWGLCGLAIEEPLSPPMLESKDGLDAKGKGKGKGRDLDVTRACRAFQRGACRYGTSCKFSHG
ncbi:unnamed protein product [Effrenium voratum]|nr:unnamed protein product [Effrenium voratum]